MGLRVISIVMGWFFFSFFLFFFLDFKILVSHEVEAFNPLLALWTHYT